MFIIAVTTINTKKAAVKLLLNGGGGGDLNFRPSGYENSVHP